MLSLALYFLCAAVRKFQELPPYSGTIIRLIPSQITLGNYLPFNTLVSRHPGFGPNHLTFGQKPDDRALSLVQNLDDVALKY